MNLIKQAINYTKDAWNSLRLSTKINDFYVTKNTEHNSNILSYEEGVFNYLKEGNIEAAYRNFQLIENSKDAKERLERFKQYLEEEHDN
jgi:hypothetical protein